MRVNVYAEEMTDRVEIIAKEIDGHKFTGLRFYLELPVTLPTHPTDEEPRHVSGPFMHRPGDDDSAAVTFWGKRDLRLMLVQALSLLDRHYAERDGAAAPVPAREWIPVGEQEPPTEIPVLIATDHKNTNHRINRAILTERVHGEGIWSWAVEDYKFGPHPLRGHMNVTHWMPLPPPPAADKPK